MTSGATSETPDDLFPYNDQPWVKNKFGFNNNAKKPI